jgi:CHAT domain-containing protein/Tfp pilus assembly protein PilF
MKLLKLLPIIMIWLSSNGLELPTVVALAQAPNQIADARSDKLAEATQLGEQADKLEEQGKYREAIRLAEQALSIRKDLLGAEHAEVSFSLDHLAGLHMKLGEYSTAEKLYKQALELDRKNLGVNDTDFTMSLRRVAEVYLLQGRLPEAEELFNQAMEIEKRNSRSNNVNFANILDSFGLLRLYQGQFSEAESALNQSLGIKRSVLKDTDPEVSYSLTILALLYIVQERQDEAEAIQNKIPEIYRNDTINLPGSLISTGIKISKYYSKGKYKTVELILKSELKRINDNPKAEYKLHRMGLLNTLGLTYLSQSQNNKAIEVLRHSLDEGKQILDKNSVLFANTLKLLAISYSMGGDTSRSIEYFKQSLEIEEHNLLINLDTGSEQQKQDYLSFLNLVLPSVDVMVDFNFKNIDSLEARQLALAATLQRKGRILGTLAGKSRQTQQDLKISDQSTLEYLLQGIQKGISTDTALIEIVQYSPYQVDSNSLGEPHYAAYIMDHTGQIKAINIGLAEPINDALTAHRQNLQDLETEIPQVKESARKLDALLMQPIRKQLGNTRNLLLSPDGDLNLLPFETLVDENNKYLLETYNITYLTSGRDLQRITNPKANNNPSLILADPYFGKSGTLIANLTRAATFTDLAKQAYSPLRATRSEANSIAELFNTKPLLGSNATEAAIKQTNSPKILHISTHGFFLPTSETNKTDPLLNSGLVLAGVQVGQSGGTEDGILTALEVSNLNLTGTKLVTLSACETALGKISIGEGVYGLRRAIAIAGAESQTISLWQVADDATKDLMVNYYTRLKKGEGRSEALHNAQRDMLKSEKYSHPYYWAAFIPSGDWRPLSN